MLILSGQGCSILWPEGEERTTVNWTPGSVVVPPDKWFHQHFNYGATRARYLALRWGSWKYRFARLGEGAEGSTYKSLKEGGAQIEYEDEDPQIHRDFEAAVANAGALCGMAKYHPNCTQRKAA